MSSQICLKWNSFLSNIATSFESLWEEEGLVDVTLASDGQCLTAHKVILSASSPFFKKVFQKNPCQHPVIILQDVHFTELEALLIFIYKGEVNIDQKNLPALLKAAETLQIRGLSGSDVFTNESYKRLAELNQEQEESDEVLPIPEISRKKQKISKNNTILEKSLGTRLPLDETTNESNTTEKNTNPTSGDNGSTRIYQPSKMKMEPFDTNIEEQLRTSPSRKDTLEQMDQEEIDESQGLPTLTSSVIKETDPLSKQLFITQVHSENPSEVHETETQISTPTFIDVPSLPQSSRSDDFCEAYSDSCLKSANFACRSPELIFPSCLNLDQNSVKDTLSGMSYPPFPCPFCDKAYTSWGYRRRHIKVVHTTLPQLTCKWCLKVLPSHESWRRHVISVHNLSASDAHNGLLILEEAHMVLQYTLPTKFDTLVNIIKQSSQNNADEDTESMKSQQE